MNRLNEVVSSLKPDNVSLLPCPFCGDEAYAAYETYGLWTIECYGCGALVDGIEAWNTRAERTCHADEVTHRNCKYSVNRGWRERTCHVIGGKTVATGYEYLCESCCELFSTAYTEPNYCPNCGAKVVKE